MTRFRRGFFVLFFVAAVAPQVCLSGAAAPASGGETELELADARPIRKGMKRDRYREMQERLEKFLKKHPKADTDGDGHLTPKEMRTYRKGPAPDFADVRYGEYERNVLDVWTAVSDEPTPLVIYIHGGGFIQGDKSGLNMEITRNLLAASVSVAAINYRYTTTAPYPAPMLDAARAVQFLKLHAQEYNLDPERFAASGGSAGGVISLWLAFHVDLADPESEDPVLRQSTRLACAVPSSVPTSLEADTIRKWVGGEPERHPALLPFFGIESVEDMKREEVKKLAYDASPVNHLTEDDPPVFMNYKQPNIPLSENWTPGEMIHHPRFGVHLKEAMDAIGVEAVLRYPDYKVDDYEDKWDFLFQKLGVVVSE
jgi:acetyl esterase/lipase